MAVMHRARLALAWTTAGLLAGAAVLAASGPALAHEAPALAALASGAPAGAAPGSGAPGSQALDSHAPDSQAPDSQAPDSQAPEAPAASDPNGAPALAQLDRPESNRLLDAVQADDSGTLIEIDADRLTYNQDRDTATAEGEVVIVYGPRRLQADRVVYDRPAGVMTASGNVRMREPDGTILYADYAEVTGDLRQAFADQIRVLLSDGSRFAAVQGDRYDDRVTVLDRAVYSPCYVCQADPDRPPLWQIRARRVIHDQAARDIIYEDATVEFMGVPTLYTPYFSHPDPTVDRRSGFLFPRVGIDKDVGAFARNYYYWAIAPNQDATFEAHTSTEKGLLLAGEYRALLEDAQFEIAAGGTFGPREVADDDGGDDVEVGPRGHLIFDGQWHLNEEFRAVADVNLVSDDTYLEEFDFSDDDILTSSVYLEWFRHRHYGILEARMYQDLREDVADNEPVALPNLQLDLAGEPGALGGGTWTVDTGVLALHRSDGPESRRLSVEGDWSRRLIFEPGVVVQGELGLIAVGYNYADQRLAPRGDDISNNGTRGRGLPYGRVEASLPLERSYSFGHHAIEPVAALVLTPRLSNNDQFPNEDSTDIEFDASNLFEVNRFPGLDRIESGTRVDYALRSEWVFQDGGSAGFLVGQSLRFSEDPAMPDGSGLEDRLSDVVGALELSPAPWLDMDYRFRLDNTDLDSRRQEVRLEAGPDDYRFGGSYVFARTVEGSGTENSQQASVFGRAAIDDFWTLSARHRQDLGGDADPIETSLTLAYANECFVFSLTGERDYTSRDGLNPGTSVFFNIALKNLGDF